MLLEMGRQGGKALVALSDVPDQFLRIGIIGLGFGGQQALDACQHLGHVQIVALADLDETKLTSWGQAYNVSHRYKHYEELLARHNLDAVSIALPNHLHALVAIQALRQGLHVLCEKPMACTHEEAQQMVQAAQAAQRVLRVVYNYREREDVQALKKLVSEGLLGKIYYARGSWMRRKHLPKVGSWQADRIRAGGGALIDIGVHVLDILLYLLGEPQIRTVSASTYSSFIEAQEATTASKATTGLPEDLATVYLRFANGTTVTLECSWATHRSSTERLSIQLYGTEGGAEILTEKLDARTNTFCVYKDVAGVPTDMKPQVRYGGPYHRNVMASFLTSIRTGDWTLHTEEKGIERAKIIDACYISASQGREVAFNEKATSDRP